MSLKLLNYTVYKKYYINVKNPMNYPLLYEDTAQWKVRFCGVPEVLHKIILHDLACKINHVSTNYTKLMYSGLILRGEIFVH